MKTEDTPISATDDPLGIEAMWEYGDPAVSEARFRAAMDASDGDDRLEVQTQVARALGLRGLFGEAHAVLDEVEQQLGSAGVRPQIRYLLERGRVFNSSGAKTEARSLFAEAWERGQNAGFTGLAVDAAHMLAIVSSGTPEAIEWNERGLELARDSRDAKARALIPAMLNNLAWDLHQMGRYDDALKRFQEAEAEWRKRGKAEQIRIATWSVARCLRSLGRHEEAIAIQRRLEAQHARAGTADGYVFEEIAENLDALGFGDEARPYFGRAYDLLADDAFFAANEADRLARLKQGSGRP
jgi:tetratricopeptide (TPR) repeat protein